MSGLIFVGMLAPDHHNPEERRFVQELSRYFIPVHYLRGVGVKGLSLHQLQSLPSRLYHLVSGGAPSNGFVQGSLAIVPLRSGPAFRLNAFWLRGQLERLAAGSVNAWTLWIRFPSPELVEALGTLPLARIVYEPIDRYASAPNFSDNERGRILDAEAKLSRRATVITGGHGLAQAFKAAMGGSHWLPFGNDLAHESRGPGIPETIARPRLGLAARLDWRVDQDLLRELASHRPDWQLILAGPRENGWGKKLDQLKNVHWLGSVPVERIRQVVRDCDVTLIPYHLTDWTAACLPVKLFDYLAEGKPVIATPLPELAAFADVVTTAERAGFQAAVERALLEGEPEAASRRRQAAVRFTLQDRARRAAELFNVRSLPAVS